MSWAGIASNQCVSLNNLKDAVATGVFTQLTTIPTGTKQITKSEASTYVNCSTSYAPFAAKSSNQLVVKSNLVARISLSFSLTIEASNAGTMDIYTASPAGAGFTLSTTLSTNGATFNVTLLAGDAFYVTLTHTARATSAQRGQIATIVNSTPTYVQTAAGALPKTVSSASTTLVNGNTYSATGLFGNPV
jgi:hypothetical protein